MRSVGGGSMSQKGAFMKVKDKLKEREIIKLHTELNDILLYYGEKALASTESGDLELSIYYEGSVKGIEQVIFLFEMWLESEIPN